MVLLLSSLVAAAEVHAVLLNGGAAPEANWESHLDHLQGVHAALRQRGVAPERITVFSADGEDPTPDRRTLLPHADDWLLTGTREQHRAEPKTVDSAWPGVSVATASPEALGDWFAAPSALRGGDTLLLYATDHGTEEGLDLWDGETLTPDQLRAHLDTLPAGVRTVMVMSQCHSGTFQSAVVAATGDVCAFYAVPADRKAYGCYAGSSVDRLGHGFAFIDALGSAASAKDAHQAVWLADDSPDVPLRSSDLYLEAVVEARAAEADMSVDRFVATRLSEATPTEAEIGALTEIARRFGLPEVLDPTALEGAGLVSRSAAQSLQQASSRWSGLLGRLNSQIMGRLGRVSNSEPRTTLTARMRAQAEADGTWSLTEAVHQRAEEAEAAWWRALTREAVNERIRRGLTRVVGERLVAAEPDAHPRLRQLTACEADPLGVPPAVAAGPDPEPWSASGADTADAHLPASIGIRIDERDARLRVRKVEPGTPAERAGLQAGDVVAQIDGRVVDRATAPALVALAQVGQPLRLAVLRGQTELEIVVSPRRDPG